MKVGFEVDNRCYQEGDNCILVYNYQSDNIVYNLPLNLEILSVFKDKNSIGIWKIKTLKNKSNESIFRT